LSNQLTLPNHHFEFASDKMEVHRIRGSGVQGAAGEPFKEEGNTRGKMNKLLRQAGIQEGDLFIVSDVSDLLFFFFLTKLLRKI